jgi:peptidoglycan/LPS O-acetylase OafA/YrhL
MYTAYMPSRTWPPSFRVTRGADSSRSLPRLHGIDALRGLAASMIVVFHIVGINRMALPPALSFISSYFGLGVPLFFVISAFSLFYTYSERMAGLTEVSAYLIRRFARIAPLFYAMLVVWIVTSHYKLHQTFSLAEIVANLTFVFNFIPAWQTSIVWAGWSIGVEFLFYALLPMLVSFVRDARAAVIVLLVCLAVAWSFQSAPATPEFTFFTYGPFFAMGIIAWTLSHRKTEVRAGKRNALCAVCAAVVPAILMVSPGPFRTFLWALSYKRVEFYMWGGVFMLLVYSQAVHPLSLISNRVTRFLGEISFSLYLLHPWLILMFAPVYSFLGRRVSPGLCFCISTIGTFAVLVPFAWVAYRVIEVPGISFGKALTLRRRNVSTSQVARVLVEVAPSS